MDTAWAARDWAVPTSACAVAAVFPVDPSALQGSADAAPAPPPPEAAVDDRGATVPGTPPGPAAARRRAAFRRSTGRRPPRLSPAPKARSARGLGRKRARRICAVGGGATLLPQPPPRLPAARASSIRARAFGPSPRTSFGSNWHACPLADDGVRPRDLGVLRNPSTIRYPRGWAPLPGAGAESVATPRTRAPWSPVASRATNWAGVGRTGLPSCARPGK